MSAILDCRNCVRAYDVSWSLLQNEVLLENMYKTWVGFYVFAGCSVIDLVFALRVGDTTTLSAAYRYIPMLLE